MKSESEELEQLLRSELLQFKAELRHGFNQASTGKDVVDLAMERIMPVLCHPTQADKARYAVSVLEGLKGYSYEAPFTEDFTGDHGKMHIVETSHINAAIAEQQRLAGGGDE